MADPKQQKIPDEIVKKIVDDLSSKDRSPIELFEQTKRNGKSQKEAHASLANLRNVLEEQLTEVNKKMEPHSTEDAAYAKKLKTSIQQVEKAQIYFGDPKLCSQEGRKAGSNNFDDYKTAQDAKQSSKDGFSKPKAKKNPYGDSSLPDWIKEFGKMAAAIREKLGWDEAIKGKMYDAAQAIKGLFAKDSSKNFDPVAAKKKPEVTIEDMPPQAAEQTQDSAVVQTAPDPITVDPAADTDQKGQEVQETQETQEIQEVQEVQEVQTDEQAPPSLAPAATSGSIEPPTIQTTANKTTDSDQNPASTLDDSVDANDTEHKKIEP